MIPQNPSKQFISSHGLVSGVLRAAIFLAMLGFAFRAGADTLAAEPTCVFRDLKFGEACPAYSTSRALEFLSVGEEAIIFIEREPKIAKAERTSVLASSRIEDAVLLEQIDEDDAMLLEREIQELSGARYELPKSRNEVKKIVGFPDSAEVANEDWIEMIRVHVEMTLSLSKNASRFLLEQLGLASSATTAAAAVATVLPLSANANAAPLPANANAAPSSANSLPAVIKTH